MAGVIIQRSTNVKQTMCEGQSHDQDNAEEKMEKNNVSVSLPRGGIV